MSIKKMFDPQSIAIIGASARASSVGYRVIEYLLKFGYAGSIYPINPKYDELQGLTCYRTIRDVPGDIDLAIIAVAKDKVVSNLTEGKDKIGNAVIFSSGFAEADLNDTDQKVLSDLHRQGLHILGPNSIGFYRSDKKVSATFTRVMEKIEPSDAGSSIAFLTQSGSYGARIFSAANNLGLNFNYFIHTGNEAGIGLVDVAKEFVDDAAIQTILMYVESVRDGRALLQTVRSLKQNDKQVVILCGGVGQAGKKAAQSHTAALSPDGKVIISLLEESGAIVVNTAAQLLDAVVAIHSGKRMLGPRVAIATTSGGAGVVGCDIAESLGLEVPELSAELQKKLKQCMPFYGSPVNPVDFTANFINDSSGLKKGLRILMDSPEIDAVAVHVGGFLEDIREVFQSYDKPIFVSYNDARTKDFHDYISLGIPLFQDIGLSLENMKYIRRKPYRKQFPEPRPLSLELGGAKVFTDLLSTMDQYGLPMARWKYADNMQDILKAAGELGYPVVLKGNVAPDAHKTELNAVRVGLADADEVERHAKELLQTFGGVIVQEMVKGTLEMICGIKRDEVLGDVVMIGWGGIFAEVLEDIAIGSAPIDASDAKALVSGCRFSKLLRGYRGIRIDEDALYAMIARISRLLTEGVKEIEFNPIMIDKKGDPVIVDARLIKEES